ncbi:MAG: methyltransferase domain-containing protein [Planctomycetota bacterium]
MRKSVKEFVEACAGALDFAEPVYEFGSLQVEGQAGFADLRPLFPGREYVGCDCREGRGVDRVLDLHALELADGTAGSVLCLDTLEHVEFPRRAVAEMLRVLEPGGVIAISSTMYFPVHEHPHDYWRFTPDGFASLLRGFDYSLVESAGWDDFPALVVGVGRKGAMPEAEAVRLADALGEWKTRWSTPPLCPARGGLE